jgi:hypothetical protein
MGLKDRIVLLLGGDQPAEGDPDEPVAVAEVALSEAPVLVAGLRDRGIGAQYAETFNILTAMLTNARIFVRRADARAATEALERLR